LRASCYSVYEGRVGDDVTMSVCVAVHVPGAWTRCTGVIEVLVSGKATARITPWLPSSIHRNTSKRLSSSVHVCKARKTKPAGNVVLWWLEQALG